jgi:serine/threonine protein kinase
MKRTPPTVGNSTKMPKFMPGENPGQKGPAIASASERLKPGKLFASFELQRELESASIWLAQDYSVGREVDQVELKFLPDLIARDKTAVEKLRNGIRRITTLKHPNILRVYDLAESKGMVAIEAEYVEGQSLSRLRLSQPNQVFEVRDLERWLDALCGSLAYAHSEVGMIHGDIKPSCLIIDSAGNLKLKDFGIDTFLADSAGRSMPIHGLSNGLPYRSPQRVTGSEPSVADDVYSIGVTIFELLTGKLPFYAGDVGLRVDGAVLSSMTERRAELGIKGEAIPKHWEETVAACLTRDPLRRPQSAAELQKRLKSESDPSKAPAGGEPLPKSISRRRFPAQIPTLPKRWLAIVGIILAFVLAIAFLSFLLTKPKVGNLASNSVPTKADGSLPKASSPTSFLGPSPALSDAKEEPLASPTPSMVVKSSPLVKASPTPLAEATPTPYVEASPMPSPEVSSTPAEVKPTPSADLGVGVTPSRTPASATTPSATPSSAAVSQSDSDTIKEDVVRRINAMPGVTAEKKASLVSKMNKARSMERLAVIPFDSGQSTLRRAAADEVVKTFDTPEMHDKLSDPTIVLVVAGYADSGGRPDLNLRISQARAESVGRILKEQVKLLNAMQTIGMGGTELLNSKRPDLNRAVEVWAVVPL